MPSTIALAVVSRRVPAVSVIGASVAVTVTSSGEDTGQRPGRIRRRAGLGERDGVLDPRAGLLAGAGDFSVVEQTFRPQGPFVRGNRVAALDARQVVAVLLRVALEVPPP